MSTSIEWVRNPDGSKGETWPVVTGCTPVSEGCRNCYAARMAATRLKYHPRYAGLATFSNGKARWTGEVRLNHDVLEQPLHWKKPRRVFIASMGDLFHPDVPFEFVLSVWRIMWQAKQHCFQILTKRPDRMLDFLEHLAGDTRDGKPHLFGTVKVARSLLLTLPNVWLGTSIENQAAADERIHWLLQAPAAVRFVSVEPMLGAIDLQYLVWLDDRYYAPLSGKQFPMPMSASNPPQNGPRLDWVICGGESGPGARPMHPDWARSLRDQCQVAGVPFFFKAWGAWLPMGQGAPECDTSKIHMFSDLSETRRVGKKRAGHLLDGRAWQEFPVADGAGNRWKERQICMRKQ